MDIFQFVNRLSSDSCLTGDKRDELYLEEGKWFRLDRIQSAPLDVASLKKFHGDRLLLTIHFIGKIVIKAGVIAEGKSFVWCGEKTLESPVADNGTCEINLGKVQIGTLEITLYAAEESVIFANAPFAHEKKIDPQYILYSFLSPTYELCCEEPLYYRFWGEHIYYSYEDQSVHMGENSSVDLLTYFNAFSAVKWEKYTNVDRVSIYLDFKGEATAEAVCLGEDGESTFATWKLQAESRTTLELPLGKYPETGIWGLRIHAGHESVLYGGGYLTDVPEMQTVHLGIGITTFRREEAVKAAVARLGKAIAGHPLYHDAIEITVVDNGQTLVPEDVPAANLIPNRNLGGTGGFMRSLIHYQDKGGYTHCLFMDDDATCEAGALFRSMSFIRHALDPKLALSGAMLNENIQFLQWENGAWFDGGCHPLKHDLDLRDPQNLLSNESETSQRIYGAWWFFFFPIAEVQQYSLPFFVRGDDIDFSYSNDFLIKSLNGVSCWQEDFKTKENAMTVYLFLRSHIVHHLTIPRLKCSFRTIWKILWGHFERYNNSYLYGSAACVNLAIKHVLKGPKFWEDNIVPTEILKQIKNLSACETPLPLTKEFRASLIPIEKNLKTRIFPVRLRKMSCYGHLLPNFMIRKTPQDMMYKWQMPNKNRVYMHDQVFMVDEVARKKTLLKRNVKYYFKNSFNFFALMLRLFIRYGSLRDLYGKEQKTQRTQIFWKKQFKG